MGTWMTTNCRKTCGKCKCNCCSFNGKQHSLGSRIQLPEKCGELVCVEGLIAPDSTSLAGAVQHNISHPEELTLEFRTVHWGSECCVLPFTATTSNGSIYTEGTMVAEGWSGKDSSNRMPVTCCHGILSTPISQKATEPSTTTTTTTTTTNVRVSDPCEDGWIQWNKNCYWQITELLTWPDAEKKCVEKDSHLASINSEEENDFIFGKAAKKARSWIGGRDIEVEGTWSWIDNSPWNYTNWNRVQPDNARNIEDCLEIGYHAYAEEWNDLPCTYKLASVCKKIVKNSN